MDGQRIAGMTPAEVHGYFTAYGVRLKHSAADLDRGAWLIGSYTGTAVNAPKKYPRKPRNAEKIMGKNAQKSMTDEEMQSFAFDFAKRWNHAYQSGNPADPIPDQG